MIETLPIADIQIGERYRADSGDIGELAESIKGRGLLHPPVVTSRHELVCGFRRIQAMKRLGWVDTPVRVIDPDDLLLAERDENDCRKEFTASEKVAIAQAIANRIGDRQGKRINEGEPKDNYPEVESGQQTREVAAKAAGFKSDFSYRQAAPPFTGAPMHSDDPTDGIDDAGEQEHRRSLELFGDHHRGPSGAVVIGVTLGIVACIALAVWAALFVVNFVR